MQIHFIFISLLVFLFVSSATAMPELKNHPIVDKIEITGLWRTKPSVIRRELLFREHDELTSKVLLASVQRLKNLRIFSKVIPTITLKPNNKAIVTINIQEKWTVIPYMNISGGGGTTYAYGGVYDMNTFGRYIETGVQYDNWNGRQGGIAWLRDPRFLNQRLLFGLDAWSIQRVRQLYTSNAISQGNFTFETKKINFLLKKEINPIFFIGSALEINGSELNKNETNDMTDGATLHLLNNSNKNTRIFTTFLIDFGKLNYDNYLVQGKSSRLQIKYSNAALGSKRSTTKIDWENQLFFHLPYHANAGFRFKFGWTNTHEIQDLYYIGGFNNIRGYLDGQFRDKTYWQLNAEYRIPSFRNNWLVLQHIFFVDTANTSDSLKNLSSSGLQHTSAGIGLRIISPRIYSFNARIDIAFFTSGNSPNYVSFGSQQYF